MSPSGIAALQQAAAALQVRLVPLLPGFEARAVAEIGSTNTALLERARAGNATPALLVALHQNAGRGRMGRIWESRPGDSLTFSLALPLAPRDFGGLSLAVGVALAEALDAADAPIASGPLPRLWLKWPNDLVCIGDSAELRKLGGILIETLPVCDRRMVVIGIGINLRAPGENPVPSSATGADLLPSPGLVDLSPGANLPNLAYLAEGWPAPTPAAVLMRAVPPLVQALSRFERDGFAAFAAAFRRRDALAGRRVQTTDPALPEGLALGVAVDGALLVQPPGGTPRPVVSGEVSVRAVDGER